MKKYFVLFVVLILAIGFSVSCMNEEKILQREISYVGKPVVIQPFWGENVFVAMKDSEQIMDTMGRVIVGLQTRNASYHTPIFSAFIIPYRNIPKGTQLKLKEVACISRYTESHSKFLMVE